MVLSLRRAVGGKKGRGPMCILSWRNVATPIPTELFSMAKRLAVVVSQGQSQNPAKRQLEEDVVTGLLFEDGIDVTVIPNLYDLKPDGTGVLALQGISTDLIVVSWLYPRAAHWVLDRHGILGKVGHTLLEMEDEDDEEQADAGPDDKDRVIEDREIPNRHIYCLDLRASEQADDYIAEIKRIAAESTAQVVDLMNWVGGSPKQDQLDRFQKPLNDTALGTDLSVGSAGPTAQPKRIEEDPSRRWYPVIDFSRCTNCMECIDFCLFGVYGVDGAETILVEQPDNCRKGCPACSRVCPENAIIFPQHKTPAIAGADVGGETLKIDLSRLFGAPETNESAAEIAAKERDEQLVLAGRDAVGMEVPRGSQRLTQAAEKDELDDLIDELDDLDL